MSLNKNDGNFLPVIDGVLSGRTSQVAGMNKILNDIVGNTNYNYIKKLEKGTYLGTASDLETLINSKEPKFDKRSGFNLNKSDATNLDSSTTIATSKAVKSVADLANTKEPKFNKNSGFNLPKTDSVTSTSSSALATSAAVKTAYDRGTSAYNLANGKEPKFSKNSGFNLNKSNSITSTSQNTLATSYAVKQVNDKIDGLFGISTTNSEKTLDMGIFKVKIKSITATGPANVDFEVPFENECFTVIFTDEGNSFSSQRLNSFNSTGFNVSTSSVGDKFRYLAIGY